MFKTKVKTRIRFERTSIDEVSALMNSDIPQEFRDLIIVLKGRRIGSNQFIFPLSSYE